MALLDDGSEWDGRSTLGRAEPVRLVVVLDDVAREDGTLLLPAEDVLQADMSGNGLQSHLGFCRRDSKTFVVPLDEFGQSGFCFVDGLGPDQAEMNHEPLLRGSPEPLDAALGLRRPGWDMSNPQFGGQPANLTEWHLPLQQLLKGCVLGGEA